MPWNYDTELHRYRDTLTGRFISAEQVLDLAGELADRTGPAVDRYAEMLAGDQLNTRDWQTLMRREIKDVYIQQYLLGRGGLGSMTPQDWGSVGGMLGEQYRYLDGFAAEVAAGNLSEAQIAMRARMYINSANEAFWRATQRARGWPKLPAYPGDGTSECLTNCRCFWDVRAVESYWEATWLLREAEHCATCLERAAMWNPLRLEADA